MSDEKMAERATAYIAQQRAQFTDGLSAIHTAHLRLQAALDVAIKERAEARAEVERLKKDLRQSFPIRYETSAGCLCPAGANISCQNAFCPRRNPPGVTC